jgi:hypothetical protein
MTVDPSDPDTFEADEKTALTDTPETPEADAAEQHTEVRPDQEAPVRRIDPGTADEADVAEQSLVVPLDEDEYR